MKKTYTKLIDLTFECGSCGLEFSAEGDDVNFSAEDNECDLCGSHGEVTAWVKCTKCEQYGDVILYSW